MCGLSNAVSLGCWIGGELFVDDGCSVPYPDKFVYFGVVHPRQEIHEELKHERPSVATVHEWSDCATASHYIGTDLVNSRLQ